MKLVDRLLQRWRIRVAGKHIPAGARVLDIGSWRGDLADQISWLGEYWGIDPKIESDIVEGKKHLLKGYFPQALPDNCTFDVVTMLAVLEHIPRQAQAQLAQDITKVLAPGGTIIITVPSPIVDGILSVLKALRVIDGMSVDEHYGFNVEETLAIFESEQVKLALRARFQLGCNNLFVFRRIS